MTGLRIKQFPWSLQCMTAIWLLSIGTLVVYRRFDAVTIGTDFIFPVLVAILAWISTRIVRGDAPPLPASRQPRLMILAQLSVIVAAIALTGMSGLRFHGLTSTTIPPWDALIRTIAPLGDVLRIGENQAINFATYVVLPGVFVLLLGAKVREIGFERFAPGSWKLAVLWLAFPAIGWIVALATGQSTIARMLWQLLRNALSNGFSEEFLFRGLLFTRLRAVLSGEVALVLQALVFGLWHFGYDFSSAPNHNVISALADMFASQVVIGYGLGWLMLKTGNIVLPSVFHLAIDSLGDAFGAK
ncbi:MAG: CPBP family intramembrane glutamic endopeptidase [Candidatus Cybelea sp.]